MLKAKPSANQPRIWPKLYWARSAQISRSNDAMNAGLNSKCGKGRAGGEARPLMKSCANFAVSTGDCMCELRGSRLQASRASAQKYKAAPPLNTLTQTCHTLELTMGCRRFWPNTRLVQSDSLSANEIVRLKRLNQTTITQLAPNHTPLPQQFTKSSPKVLGCMETPAFQQPRQTNHVLTHPPRIVRGTPERFSTFNPGRPIR